MNFMDSPITPIPNITYTQRAGATYNGTPSLAFSLQDALDEEGSTLPSSASSSLGTAGSSSMNVNSRQTLDAELNFDLPGRTHSSSVDSTNTISPLSHGHAHSHNRHHNHHHNRHHTPPYAPKDHQYAFDDFDDDFYDNPSIRKENRPKVSPVAYLPGVFALMDVLGLRLASSLPSRKAWPVLVAIMTALMALRSIMCCFDTLVYDETSTGVMGISAASSIALHADVGDVHREGGPYTKIVTVLMTVFNSLSCLSFMLSLLFISPAYSRLLENITTEELIIDVRPEQDLQACKKRSRKRLIACFFLCLLSLVGWLRVEHLLGHTDSRSLASTAGSSLLYQPLGASSSTAAAAAPSLLQQQRQAALGDEYLKYRSNRRQEQEQERKPDMNPVWRVVDVVSGIVMTGSLLFMALIVFDVPLHCLVLRHRRLEQSLEKGDISLDEAVHQVHSLCALTKKTNNSFGSWLLLMCSLASFNLALIYSAFFFFPQAQRQLHEPAVAAAATGAFSSALSLDALLPSVSLSSVLVCWGVVHSALLLFPLHSCACVNRASNRLFKVVCKKSYEVYQDRIAQKLIMNRAKTLQSVFTLQVRCCNGVPLLPPSTATPSSSSPSSSSYFSSLRLSTLSSSLPLPLRLMARRVFSFNITARRFGYFLIFHLMLVVLFCRQLYSLLSFEPESVHLSD